MIGPSANSVSFRGPRFDTLAAGASYGHDDAAANSGAVSPPIYATASQHFESAETMEAALAGHTEAWIYSRLGNPTIEYLERVVADLEGYRTGREVSAAVTASGMAAVYLATSPFLAARGSTPMNIVAASSCYGATFMTFSQRYGIERGVDVRWVDDSSSLQQWADLIDSETRFAYAEVPANPVLDMVDIGGLAAVAHERGVPLIVDSTLASSALMRPLGLGADIVVQALGKVAGASGANLGGAVIARHGLTSNFADDAMIADFAGYLRRGPIRDMGSILSPFAAFTLSNDIRELRRRVDLMSQSALQVAEMLDRSDAVAEVIYPGLSSHASHGLAHQMVLVDSDLEGEPLNRFGSVLCFRPRGGVAATRRVFDRFKLIWRANDLGRVKSSATIPAISTHRQMVESGRGVGAIPADLIRLSVGVEHVDDILNDVVQALEGA